MYELLGEVEKVNKGRLITFHEIVTAAFFLGAARTKAHLNILEAGLFFRLDSSNVLEKNIASIEATNENQEDPRQIASVAP